MDLRRLFFFCLAAAIFLPVALAADAVLHVRADSWMPYNGAPTDAQPGYVVELLHRIFDAEKIGIDYQLLGWDEALKTARAGGIDAVIGANKTECQGLLAPNESVGEPKVGLFTRAGSKWQYTSMASLKSVRLAVITGYSYWDTLDAYLAKHPDNVVVFSGDTPLDDALAKLQKGEVDVVAETLPVFVWHAKARHETMADYRIAYAHEGEAIYVAFAKTSDGERYRSLFDERLRGLRKSGELAKILAKYGVSDWSAEP